MKCGVTIRTMGPQSTQDIIQQCAQSAEQLGFDSLILLDHLCIPPDETEGSGGRYLEALITLGFLNPALDHGARDGSSVISVLPRRYRMTILMLKECRAPEENQPRLHSSRPLDANA